jgi:hypothetical protein
VQQGSAHSSCVGPYSLSAANYGPVSSFFPRAHAKPKAAAVGDDVLGLPGEQLKAQHTVVSSQILSLRPMAAIYSGRVNISVAIFRCRFRHWEIKY